MAESPEPKKETLRITDLPPVRGRQPVVTVAPAAPIPAIAPIPMVLCWILLTISAAILILQIWNYLS